jgi:hypothetical protein
MSPVEVTREAPVPAQAFTARCPCWKQSAPGEMSGLYLRLEQVHYSGLGISSFQPITERRIQGHDKASRPGDDNENAEDRGEFGGGHE